MFSSLKMEECVELELCGIYRLKSVAKSKQLSLEIHLVHMIV